MYISPISQLSINQNRNIYSSKLDAVKNTSFGYRNEFIRAVKQGKNLTFYKSTPEYNKTLVNDIYKNLISLAEKFPVSCRSKYFDTVISFAKKNSIPDLLKLGRELGLKKYGQISLLEDSSGVYLGIYNLSTYDKGYFSQTDHEQIILEFKDPDSADFIGFSPDSDRDIAVTTQKSRVELYDRSSGYQFKSLSNQGYKPKVYQEYLNLNGEPLKQSFWDWFKNL